MHILLVQPQRFDPQPDVVAWGNSSNGEFSSKSAWLLTKNFTCTPPFESWNWVRNVRANPRIRNFIWLAALNRLKTKALLFLRKITQNDLCDICKTVCETMGHVLRDCCVAKAIWADVTIPSGFVVSFSLSPSSWLKSNCESKLIHCSGIPWSVVFPFTCWNIWLLRNKSLFNPDLSRAGDPITSTTKAFCPGS
ncbi:hypothetical protein Vadar_012105 [Vaccinium darrowii]|uniref:Uncharacterized protein n=1 Tax=Vaccinium darrowii TaxID=229202 RepID=A0ACB7XZB2_9ERIC|nr:hypothetical protein Vadar_012105 [Vaccinium darrowii]